MHPLRYTYPIHCQAPTTLYLPHPLPSTTTPNHHLILPILTSPLLFFSIDDSSYLSWAEWSSCNATCAGGLRGRERECDGEGEGCEGPPFEWELCNTQYCPVNGSYGDWEDWSECSASCGIGQRQRNRNCVPPTYGGAECGDVLNSVENCTLSECPTEHNYGEWSTWSECNATCGSGFTKNRTRLCSLEDSALCMGQSVQIVNCVLPECMGEAVWSEWGQWSLCSVSCGGGKKRRYRSCISGFCNDTYVEITPDECHVFSCYPLPVTCSELRTSGMHENREAEIDPTGIEPFWVFCDMSDDDQLGITEIIHDHPGLTTMTGNNMRDGVSIDFKYNVTLDQIDILVSVSLVCRQYISWSCLGAPITDQSDIKLPYLYWGNKDQVARLYWGGVSDTDTLGCKCGESYTCAMPQFSCNCDAADEVIREDGGYVTSREDVPIRTFNIKATDGSWNTGNMTVGPMQCYGTDPLAVG